MKVWIEGRIVDGSEARISVLDHGFLYGDGVFEGIRVYGRRVFRLDDHLARLSASARAIGLALPMELDELAGVVCDTARALGRPECYLRLVVTRGVGALGVDPATCETPQIICIAAGIQLYAAEKLKTGVDMVTVSLRRPAADALDPRVKSLNYLNSVLAKREATLRGADEGLILNAAGLVAEAAVANVFAVRGGVLRTPPVTDGALEGITRDTVLELARSAGIVVREESLGRYDLFASDEVFLTGTGARIVPVATLDGETIGPRREGAAVRPVCEEISKHFVEEVERRGTPL